MPVEKTAFTNVDLSWGNGWTKYISVFIDSTKNVKIAIEELNKKTLYYNGQLIDTSFVKINHLISTALTQKFEDNIGIPVPDGGGAHININETIHSNVYEGALPNKLDTIISLLIDLNNYTLKQSSDTSFLYQSLNKIKPPRPIMENAVFVPPIIKDDVTEK
jgi:hypothetical protein